MRILMLSWEYPPKIVGGISRVVYDLARELGKKGNDVHVVTCREHGTEAFEKESNVSVHRVHTYNLDSLNFIDWVHHLNFAFIEYSVRLVNSTGRFDIIHAHDWVVAFSARSLKSSFSIPLVCTIHATESGRNSGIHTEVQNYIHSVEWWLTYEAWRVVVNSGYMKSEVLRLFNLPEDKVRLIPNGVDLHKFDGFERDKAFREEYAGDNEKIVFFVGRLVNEKGAHVLIDAIPKVLARCYNVKFVIAGRGPQLDYLRVKADELEVAHKVYFTGYISDDSLLSLYKCADIAVFPSLYEPFGIVALEGMVAGLPVVVSDTGGMDELVEHGVDGMKAYTGNANSLADSILELLLHPDSAGEMKKRAKEKVRNCYNWDIISMKMMEVYEEVMKENNKDW